MFPVACFFGCYRNIVNLCMLHSESDNDIETVPVTI